MSETRYWLCDSCDFSFYDSDGWETWHCPKCGEKMDEDTPKGFTPDEELRALVEEWRGWEEHYNNSEWLEGSAAGEREAIYRHCADELEELIDDE